MQKQFKLLKKEIDEFRELGHEFLDKKISVGDFKGKSGGMGVYAQRGGNSFMIRLRTNSGILKMNHLKLIDSFIKRYNLKNIHLTTRQAIQLHNLGIDDVCDIMSESLDNGLYTRGGGGNFPRNVGLAPMSGVEKNEAFDATEVANAISGYLTKQITEYKLPRKLKISISTSSKDTANSTINDIGFLGINENGKAAFKLFLAGGLGSNPEVSIEYPERIAPQDVLYCVEAMVRLFMAEGDYQNKAKARTRYIPKRMGRDEFIACFKKHFEDVKSEKDLTLDLDIKLSETLDNYTHKLSETPYLIPQRQDGLYTVIVHPTCGILASEDFHTLIKFLEENENSQARLSMNEDIYVRNLTEEQAENLLALTSHLRGNHKVHQSLSCVGVPTCQIGIEESQNLVKSILEYLSDNSLKEDFLPQIHVSGCQNSCARHQTSELGFIGGKRKVGEALESIFTLYTGGRVEDGKTKLGNPMGSMIAKHIPEFVGELSKELENKHKSFSEYTDTDEFKNLVKKYAL